MRRDRTCLLAAVTILLATALAPPTQAQPPWRDGRDWRGPPGHYRHGPPPRHRYYPPPPRYYPPPPVYYAPPPPVYYPPPAYAPPGFSFGFTVPLR